MAAEAAASQGGRAKAGPPKDSEAWRVQDRGGLNQEPGAHFGSPYIEDQNMLGSILGGPLFLETPKSMHGCIKPMQHPRRLQSYLEPVVEVLYHPHGHDPRLWRGHGTYETKRHSLDRASTYLRFEVSGSEHFTFGRVDRFCKVWASMRTSCSNPRVTLQCHFRNLQKVTPETGRTDLQILCR